MATRQGAQEHIIDLILDFIVTNAEDSSGIGINLDDYRRYIDPITGQITVGQTSSDSVVLYEKDFRESFDQSLIGEAGTGVVNEIIDECGTNNNGDYDLNMFVSDAWVYIPGGTTCDFFIDPTTHIYGGISFNGPASDGSGASSDPGLISGCDAFGADTIFYGTMGCANTTAGHVISLPLTDEVLYSLSQFITITQQQTDINEDLAEDILDTNIYELLPGGQTRQEQISKFFADYNSLKGPKPGEQGLPGFIDEDDDGTPDGWTSSGDETTYTDAHDVSDDGLTGNISRLDGDAPTGFDNQTLEWLRDDLNSFLYDIDYDPVTATTDSRPDYQNLSRGYLKFRGLNQGILIRSTEDTGVGLENYPTTGFTITMWVRFLDKVSSGTLFNYGNPLRDENPTGFMLETFMDPADSDNRYIRLVLRDAVTNGSLRDSHVGISGTNRIDTTGGTLPTNNAVYTSVPIDFSEWYFVVASYTAGTTVTEDVTTEPGLSNLQNSDFWRNNVDASGNYVASSGYGAKCKVEVISRSDLLRARGFQV